MTMRLALQNYRRFVGDTDGGPVEIDFEPGLTIITGPNGAGKTTLADALRFALFGRQRGEPDPLADAAAGGGMMVACDLLIDGRPVRIERWSDRASLWVDGTLQVQEVSGSLRGVDREIQALLGDLSAEEFLQVYVAEQGATAGLVAAGPTQRRAIVEEVLQVEVLTTAATAQANRHDRALGDVNVAGRATADALGLDEAARRHLARFASARATHTRQPALSLFGAAIDAALAAACAAMTTSMAVADALDHEVKQLEAVERQAHDDRDAARARLGDFDAAAKEHARREGVVAHCRTALLQSEAARCLLASQIDEARAAAPDARRHADIMEAIRGLDDERSRLAVQAERARAVATARAIRDGFARQVDELRGAGERQVQLVEQHRLAREAWEALEDDPTAEGFEALAGDRRAIGDDRKEAQAALEVLEAAGEAAGICPICRESLTPAAWHTLVGRYRQALTVHLPAREAESGRVAAELATAKADWQRRRREANEAAQGLLRKVEAARKDAETATVLASHLREAEANLTEVEQSLAELGQVVAADPSVDDLARQREALVQQAGTVADAANRHALLPGLLLRLGEKDDLIRDQQQAVTDAEADRDALGYDAAEHQVCRDEQTALADAVIAATAATAEKARELDRLRGEAEAARARAENGEKAAAALVQVTREYAQQARLNDSFGDFVKEYVAANTQRITRRATELIQQAATDGSILGLVLDERGQLTYLDSSSAPRPIARLSGGEKALVGLCLRLALAEQALMVARSGRLDFLFLDEVLAALDDERRDAMQRVFAAVQARGLFRHILMITHLEAVREGWPAHGLEVTKVSSKVSRLTPRPRAAALTPALEVVDG